MIGTTIANRYEIQEQIGIGGMGVVYCAHDATLRRDVAVKMIAPHLVQQAEARARFQREAQAVAGLAHPNIVAIYDFVEEPKSHGAALIMELLRGASLRQRMADKNRPAFSEVAIQTCRALEAAHAKGILHRDIKPENIFVCADGTLKLMDFGLARLLDGANSTQSGMIVGTIAYMAPEQLRGEKLDVRTDLYALGVLLYEYLSGVTPFAADNPGAVLLKHLNEAPPPLPDKLPTLPAEIEAIVLKLLAKNPADRYPSATALREALENPSPSGKTTQVELADSIAALPTCIAAPKPMPLPLEPLFPKPDSGGKGPYLVSSERKKRSLAGLLAVPVLLLTGGGAAGYLYTQRHAPPLSMVRKPQPAKTAKKPVKTKKAKPEKTQEASVPQDDSLSRAVKEERSEKAALEQERREREKLQKELAAKQNAPGYVEPGPDIPADVNDPGAAPAPAVPDNTPTAASSNAASHSVAPPPLPTLNVTAQATYQPQFGAARINVQFNSDCNIRFYALQNGDAKAVGVNSTMDRLTVSETGRGAVPIDVMLGGAANPPPLILMVASRLDLNNLKSTYTVSTANGAARTFRQNLNGDLRGKHRSNDTVVRLLLLRNGNKRK